MIIVNMVFRMILASVILKKTLSMLVEVEIKCVTLFPVRQNPERTFNWFFEAACPVARDKGEACVCFYAIYICPNTVPSAVTPL